MKGILATITNQNSIIYHNNTNNYIKTIILPKTSHPNLEYFMVWIEFCNKYILKQAYNQLLELHPTFMKITLNGEQLAPYCYTYDEVSYSSTMYNDNYFWLDISLLIQTNSQLNLLINFLQEYDDLIPLELLRYISKNPRKFGDLEQQFYTKLARINQLAQDEEGLVELAINVTKWFEQNYKIKSANYLWKLAQRCALNSNLWQQMLAKIEYGTNYYGQAQLELAHFTYDQLINLESTNKYYIDLVEQFITHAFNIPDDQDSINLLNMIIFNIIGENGSEITWNKLHLDINDDIPKIFIHTFATILLSHNRLQTENKLLKQQQQELLINSHQLSDSSSSIDTEFNALNLTEKNDIKIKPTKLKI